MISLVYKEEKLENQFVGARDNLRQKTFACPIFYR